LITTESGQKVERCQLRVPRQTKTLTPDDQGQITWRVSEKRLLELADASNRVPFRFAPALATGLLPQRRSIDIADLIGNSHLSITLKQGTRVSGQVLCRTDAQPATGVWVNLWPQTVSPNQINTVAARRLRTDSAGHWETVIPSVDSIVAVGGRVPGYRLTDLDELATDPTLFGRMSQRIRVAPGTETIEVPPFLVDRIPPRKIIVRRDSAPVAGADVRATRLQTFPNPQGIIVDFFPSLGSSGRTDDSGQFLLQLERTDWVGGFVQTSFSTEDQSFIGKAEILPDSVDPIMIDLEPPWVITGRILDQGKPISGQRVALMGKLYTRPLGDEIEASMRERLSRWRSMSQDRTNDRGEYTFHVHPSVDHRIAVVLGDPPTRMVTANAELTKTDEHRYRFGDLDMADLRPAEHATR
jgi:hypothetical protein